MPRHTIESRCFASRDQHASGAIIGKLSAYNRLQTIRLTNLVCHACDSRQRDALHASHDTHARASIDQERTPGRSDVRFILQEGKLFSYTMAWHLQYSGCEHMASSEAPLQGSQSYISDVCLHGSLPSVPWMHDDSGDCLTARVPRSTGHGKVEHAPRPADVAGTPDGQGAISGIAGD
jgi:hypothetical protein